MQGNLEVKLLRRDSSMASCIILVNEFDSKNWLWLVQGDCFLDATAQQSVVQLRSKKMQLTKHMRQILWFWI